MTTTIRQTGAKHMTDTMPAAAVEADTCGDGRYAWVITIEHVTEPGDDLPTRVGWTGPRGATDEEVEKAKRGRVFRMLDDDGGVMYHGRIWTECGPGCGEDFGPLDDLGRADAGCTEIQYYTDGKWVGL
jgi:hypothetical protein